jgi:FixJ family two-component response regulator
MLIHHLMPNKEHREIIRLAELDAKERIARLTPSERLVMMAILDGKINKNIAWDLGNSQRTIENHRLRIMEKTEVDSVVDLLRLVLLAE